MVLLKCKVILIIFYMAGNTVVIIGGGPAGMMAAISAGRLGALTTLIEKNSHLGKKLLLSGKGRCNLTNACDIHSFLERFSKNGEFLRDAFKGFFNRELMGFFEARGLGLKIERQLRVFPVTDKSDSIVKVLKKELHENGIRIVYRTEAGDIIVGGRKVKGVALKDKRIMPCDRVILATGGVSYGFTGSTGEGLDMAERLGHRIVAVRPGLVPLETSQRYPASIEGLALKNIRLIFRGGKKKIVSNIGELMFTKFGISGPLVLSLSGHISDWLDKGREVCVEIDLKPGLSAEQLDMRLVREFKACPKKMLKNTLKNLLPVRLIGVFVDITGLKADKAVSQITREERRAVVSLLKSMRLDIRGPRPIEEAMVTRGGVSLKDINPRTMESRIIKGLYFAGEMIDVDADTGGFNLQAAFSTGCLAGRSAVLGTLAVID